MLNLGKAAQEQSSGSIVLMLFNQRPIGHREMIQVSEGQICSPYLKLVLHLDSAPLPMVLSGNS